MEVLSSVRLHRNCKMEIVNSFAAIFPRLFEFYSLFVTQCSVFGIRYSFICLMVVVLLLESFAVVCSLLFVYCFYAYLLLVFLVPDTIPITYLHKCWPKQTKPIKWQCVCFGIQSFFCDCNCEKCKNVPQWTNSMSIDSNVYVVYVVCVVCVDFHVEIVFDNLFVVIMATILVQCSAV